MLYTISKWDWYSDKPAPVFTSKKDAERLASTMRTMRAWVEVIEVEKDN
jgi:hypothetical protein